MKKRLRDIATISVGYQFRGKIEPDPKGNVLVIQIRDIDESHRIHPEAVVTTTVDRPDSYFLRDGDVLFLSRGHRLFATVFRHSPENVVAASYFFVLRVSSELVRPEYLGWCINQPELQEEMRPYMRGSHMPLISKTDFQDLTIPVPSLLIQDKIVRLNDLLVRERELTNQLEDKMASLVHAISQRAACQR